MQCPNSGIKHLFATDCFYMSLLIFTFDITFCLLLLSCHCCSIFKTRSYLHIARLCLCYSPTYKYSNIQITMVLCMIHSPHRDLTSDPLDLCIHFVLPSEAVEQTPVSVSLKSPGQTVYMGLQAAACFSSVWATHTQLALSGQIQWTLHSQASNPRGCPCASLHFNLYTQLGPNQTIEYCKLN